MTLARCRRCPACKRFAPIYEAVADEIGSSSESGNMYVARADCATETVLCNRFKLKGYPSVFLGRPASFAEVRTCILEA